MQRRTGNNRNRRMMTTALSAACLLAMGAVSASAAGASGGAGGQLGGDGGRGGVGLGDGPTAGTAGNLGGGDNGAGGAGGVSILPSTIPSNGTTTTLSGPLLPGHGGNGGTGGDEGAAPGAGGGGGGGAFGGGLLFSTGALISNTAIIGGNGGRGGNGGNGTAGGGGGGGGGDGAVSLQFQGTDLTNNVSIGGGNGGNGGNAGVGGIADGAGGTGGKGALGLQFQGADLINNGSISGGNGGNGGNGTNGGFSGGAGGNGGFGGIGLTFSGNVLNNSVGATITGGNGGNGGTGSVDGSARVGGDGVIFSGTLLSNSGAIAGGNGGNGNVGGTAVILNGGSLSNRAGATITGGGADANGGFGGFGVIFTGAALSNAGVIAGGSGSSNDVEGGRGVYFAGTTLTNTGTISGGDGQGVRHGGIGLSSQQNSSIVINAGTIAGGLGIGGRSLAADIGGFNSRLELQAGYAFIGEVHTGNNTIVLTLGGAANASFDVAALGANGGTTQYQGFNSYEKTGTSTWTLTGTATHTAPWAVRAGTLNVDGSIASASMTTVESGATLTGTGLVGNTTVNAGGALAPGNNGIGNITVIGNLMFMPGANYNVDVAPNSADFTTVIGTANLAGAVNASFAPGSYVQRQYAIMVATGGVNGVFDSVVNTNLPSGFKSSLSYDPNFAYLNLTLDFTPGNLGGTSNSGLNVNQTNVANALTGFFNRTGGIPLVFGTLTPARLTQVSGELATGSQQTTFDAMTQFMGVMTDPFIAGRSSGIGAGSGATGFADAGFGVSAHAAPDQPRSVNERDAYAAIYRKAPDMTDAFDRRWSVWAAGFGGSQTTDGNATLGSNTATSRVYGTAVGADYRFSPYTLAGFAMAGGGTDFSIANGLGTGRSDLFQAGAYLRHTVGASYLSAALAYGWQDITTDRTVTVAGIDQLRAKLNANAWSGRLEGGHRFVAQGIGLTPYAAGQFVTFELPNYAETVVSGANTFALAYAGKEVTAARSEFGLRTDKSFAMQDGIFTLRGRAAWAHNFNTDRSVTPTLQTLPGASFVVNGAAQARDAALATASAEMKWLNGFSVVGTFEGEFSNVTSSYAGKGAVRYAW